MPRRRPRRVPHVRPADSASRSRATCARSSSGPATRASCITRTSASIARARRGSSTRATPSRATPAAWCATRAIPKDSCSDGRRARRRTRRRAAWRGGSSRAAISSCSCTCSRPASRRRFSASVGFFFTDTPPTRTPVGLRLGSETIDIPPGERAVRRSPIATSLPVDVDVLAIQPHAHNLARRMEADATLPDGTHALADRDRRLGFPLAGRLSLRARRSRCRRGRRSRCATPTTTPPPTSRNPHRPPARVVWGQNTSDEMGDLWMQMVPRARLRTIAMLSRGRPAQSARGGSRRVHEAARDRPRQSAASRCGRGVVSRSGRLDEAIARVSASRCGSNPESASTHYNLGIALSAARPARRGDRRVSRQRCASIPTTRRRTTTSARFCSSSASQERGARALTAARSRCGPTTSRRTPTSGSCCRRRGARPRRLGASSTRRWR